jgi:hypothetical protein
MLHINYKLYFISKKKEKEKKEEEEELRFFI